MLNLSTPRRLEKFSELYHELGGLLTAGITVTQALEIVRNAPPDRGIGRRLDECIRDIQHGFTLAESMQRRGNWLSRFDIALLFAGEKSGRLDESCKQLSQYYVDQAQLLRTTIAELRYPALVVGMAILIFPASNLTALVVNQDAWAFFKPKLQIVLFIAAIIYAVLFLGQGRRGEWWRSIWETLLNGIPFVGRARRSLALARLSIALESLFNAGVDVIQAWTLAAEVSGSPALRRATERAQIRIRAGEQPGEAIGACGVFPDKFVSLYRSGELSGQLERNLIYLRQNYESESARLFKIVAQGLPRILYLFIAAAIGYSVIQFWVGYYDQIFRTIE